MHNAGPSNEALLHAGGQPNYQRGLNTLKDTQRMVNDSEGLGQHILGQLHEQREQLNDAIDRNQDIETNLQRSNRLIRSMFHRAFTIKIGLYCFIFALLMAIGVVSYLKWLAPLVAGHHSPPPPHQPPPPPAEFASPPPALSPPPPLLASPPPPGNTTLEAALLGAEGRRLSEADPTLGPGLIALITIGAGFLFICIFARASSPAKRALTGCCLGTLYLVIVLFLVLMPTKDYSEDDSDLQELKSMNNLLRVLLGILLSCCALVGPLMLLVMHAMAPQKAPVVDDDKAALRAP